MAHEVAQKASKPQVVFSTPAKATFLYILNRKMKKIYLFSKKSSTIGPKFSRDNPLI